MRKREQTFRKLKQKMTENRSTLLGWAVLFLMLCLSLCNLCRALQVGGEIWCEKQQEETGGSVRGYLWKIEQTEKSIRLFVLGEPVVAYVPGEEAGELYPGQKIKVSGEIEPFAEARNPGQFSMRKYMRALGYGGQLRAESWNIEEAQSVLARIAERAGCGLYRLKNWISTTLEETCAAREAGILRAMLAGEKTALTEEVRSQYQAGGLSHLLSVSGLHVTILCAGAYRLLKRMRIPLPVRCGCSMVLTAGYVWLTGASVSALRAGGMFWFTMIAILLGRTYRMNRAALWMAGVLLVWHPLLLTQVGFQLSFGAIVLQRGMPLLAVEETDKKSRRQQLEERVESCLLFFVGMAPILAWHQYQISMLSLGMNVLFLPLAEPLLLSGVAGLGLTALLPVWKGVWLFPAEKLTWLLTTVCERAEQAGVGVVTTGRPAWWQIAVYSGVVTILLLVRKGIRQSEQEQYPKEGKEQKWSAWEKWFVHWCASHTMWVRYLLRGSCLVLLLASPLLLIHLPQRNLQITMLDVGQGDGILTCFADGTTMLTDGGSTDVSEVWKYRIRPALLEKGIRRLDYVLVTHGDEDHCSGIRELLADGFSVGALLLADPSESEHLQELARLAAVQGVPVRIIGRGDAWNIGTAYIKVLWSPKGATGLEENDRCLVYRLQDRAFSMLFTGDISAEIEEQIAPISSCTVLKVAHHGSKYSTSTEFLEQVQPRLALISSGRNVYGHPSGETEARLEEADVQVEETVRSGALRLEVKKNQVQLFRFCKES